MNSVPPAPDAAFRKYSYAGAYHHALMQQDEFYITKIQTAVAMVRVADVVIDIGCGDGVFVQYARERGGRVIGLDPSLEGLRLARSMVGGGGLCAASARHLPLPAQMADLVMMIDVVNYLDECDEVVAEAARVLKPGGALVIMSPFEISLQKERAQFADSWQARAWSDLELRDLAARYFAAVDVTYIKKVTPRGGLGPVLQLARRIGLIRPAAALAKMLVGRARATTPAPRVDGEPIVLNSLGLPPALAGPPQILEFILVARKGIPA